LPETCRKIFDLYEGEALRLIAERSKEGRDGRDEPHQTSDGIHQRFPLRKAYELCLKCSHLFNILDARGAISVTERVALIARIRKLAVELAKIYVDRLHPVQAAVEEIQPA